MTLITGSAMGEAETQDEIYVEGAPTIWFQDNRAPEMYNPDADGFYWQLSGTSTYKVYELGCVNGVQLTEKMTMNDVICDAVGIKASVMRRDYLEFNLTVQTIFPLEYFQALCKGGTVTTSGGVQKMGLGAVNNNQFWHLYAAKVYDESVGDYICFTAHRCQFVEAFTLDFRYGNNWQITGLKARAYADTSKPSAQQFMTVIRLDPSELTP